VAELCRRGHTERIMLSHDACATVDWFPVDQLRGFQRNWHFAHLFESILPRLAKLGVSDAQIATMLEDNPRRWLAGG
jgi:phosphotriesterase-related protein